MEGQASCCRKERLIITFTFFEIFQIIISMWNAKHLDVVKKSLIITFTFLNLFQLKKSHRGTPSILML